ncbi:hypothetical protein CRG98_031841 [Punica granatum]|uniref:CCHC-type domain-containing protein n=1 Tax=Punica granatum TaxID=22663 RepID=A0A2I0IUP0_PUNGR|nr:hypothetical protein CRG98_031841 [Punica granatum]
MAALMENQNRRNPNPNSDPDREEIEQESEGENYFADIPRRRQRDAVEHDRRRPFEEDRRRWESRMRTEIPEFHGSLKLEEFLDWLATVEEILEFKGVPEDKRNLQQGTRTVDEYTNEFFQLIVRNEVHETEDQLVATYIGGLRVQIQDTVNMFDPPSVSVAHQRALQVEKQSRRNSNFWNSPSIGSSSGASCPGGSGGDSSGVNRPRGGANRNTTNTNQPNRPTGTGMKCFECGGVGHGQSECRKTTGKKTFFVDMEGGEDEDVEEAEYPEFDSEEVVEEEVMIGDTGTALVIKRSCLTPKVVDDNWLRHNIFQSMCTILGKVCRFIIDAGSCENIVSAEVVKKLGLKAEKHPKPYKLAWLKKRGEVHVSERALVSFSIGLKYKDAMWCDVVAMDACHLLLGRPWQYDRRVIHEGRTNSYSFMFENVKIVLVPSRESERPTSMGGETKLLSLARFEEDVDESQLIYVLIGKEVVGEASIPTAVAPVVAEYVDVFPDELPDSLPPLRDIQHRIDLEPGATLPNRPHYKMRPGEHEELRRQVEELLARGHIRESLSPCAVPALLTPKKDGSWRIVYEAGFEEWIPSDSHKARRRVENIPDRNLSSDASTVQRHWLRLGVSVSNQSRTTYTSEVVKVRDLIGREMRRIVEELLEANGVSAVAIVEELVEVLECGE